MKKLIFPLIYIISFFFPLHSVAVENEMVIAQMNSCVNTLTNIINNKSMTVLEHETDQLLNNFTMQQLVGLPEIADFRIDLIDGIGKLGITEEERGLLKRLNSIKQDNLKWQVFSNALNNTMMITGGGNIGVQAGFQALVTAARAGVEYKVAQNDMQMEELQAMWDLRKDDLKTFIELRKQALGIIFSLYQKYNLKESDRLTEQTSQQFQKIITDPDAKRMVRLLLDNSSKYSHIADYYYYLGMGYIDMNNIPKAMEAFNKYEALYNKAPIYRINEKSGIISLTRLAYLDKLSTAEIERELENAQKNLPSNTMALIQCAVVYDTVLKNPKKALSVLRSALDDENTSDKAAIIIAGSLILPKVSSQSQEHKDFLSAYSNQKTIDFDAALNICIANKHNIFKFLDNNFIITELCYNPWFFGKAELNDEILISVPKRYSLDLSKIQMYVEERKNDNITVTQYILKDAKSISLKKIDKVNAFKHNPNLKYLYMESAGIDIFKVKTNLNYNSILKEDFPRQSEFLLTESDLKDIVKFLQKNEDKSTSNELIAEKIKTKNKSILEKGIKLMFPEDYEANSLYRHFKDQSDATYIKFIFDDSRKLIVCYKLDKENEKLLPCYTQYQGKIYFVNKLYLQEFGYAPVIPLTTDQNKQSSTPQTKPETESTQPKPDVKKEQSKQEEKSEKPWWKFWGSDDEPQKTVETKKVETKPQAKSETKATQSKSEVKKEQSKQEEKSEKPWWKFWSSDDEPQKAAETKKIETESLAKPETKAAQPKSEVKKEQPKQEEKSEKPWWKFWGSDVEPQKTAETKKIETESQAKPETKATQSKSEVNKEQIKHEEMSEKPWWRFWGDKQEKKNN